MPFRTSNYPFNTAQYYNSDEFGSPAAFNIRDESDRLKKTKEMLGRAFRYARSIGIKTCIGFEPASLPREIVKALPEEAVRDGNLNTNSVAAREIMTTRLDDILQSYPEVDYIWLWETEVNAWKGTDEQVEEFDASYLLFAYEYLKKTAPNVKLVISGWGSISRHFKQLDKKLPKDVIFSSLNNMLGCHEVNEVYGQIEGRELWPIPWLEDDGNLLFPQFHLRRFEKDIALAKKYHCSGFIGIHWRTRIIDHNISFMAKSSWSSDLMIDRFLKSMGIGQFSANGGNEWAQMVDQWDSCQVLPHTFFGSTFGFCPTNDAFGMYDSSTDHYIKEYIPRLENELEKLQALYAEVTPGGAGKRLDYWFHCISQMYWCTRFFESGAILKDMKVKLRSKEIAEEKKSELIRQMAEYIKDNYRMLANAIIHQANTVSNKTELGQLSSMIQKLYIHGYIREKELLREYAPELKAEFDKLVEDYVPEVSHKPRLIIFKLPTILNAGEEWDIEVVSAGRKPISVIFFWKMEEEREYRQEAMQHRGRNTFGIRWRAPEVPGAVAYFRFEAVSAEGNLMAPDDGIEHFAVSIN